MNTPRETPGPLRDKEVRKVQIGKVSIPEPSYVQIDSANGVDVHVNGDYQIALLTRQEAIDAAQAILIAYNVPFCNRVAGAGLEK